MDFRIYVPKLFSPKWFSYKFNGPGLRYEEGISIQKVRLLGRIVLSFVFLVSIYAYLAKIWKMFFYLSNLLLPIVRTKMNDVRFLSLSAILVRLHVFLVSLLSSRLLEISKGNMAIAIENLTIFIRKKLFMSLVRGLTQDMGGWRHKPEAINEIQVNC